MTRDKFFPWFFGVWCRFFFLLSTLRQCQWEKLNADTLAQRKPTEQTRNQNICDESIWANGLGYIIPYLPMSMQFFNYKITFHGFERKKKKHTENAIYAQHTIYAVDDVVSWRQNFWYKRTDKFLHIQNVFGNRTQRTNRPARLKLAGSWKIHTVLREKKVINYKKWICVRSNTLYDHYHIQKRMGMEIKLFASSKLYAGNSFCANHAFEQNKFLLIWFLLYKWFQKDLSLKLTRKFASIWPQFKYQNRQTNAFMINKLIDISVVNPNNLYNSHIITDTHWILCSLATSTHFFWFSSVALKIIIRMYDLTIVNGIQFGFHCVVYRIAWITHFTESQTHFWRECFEKKNMFLIFIQILNTVNNCRKKKTNNTHTNTQNCSEKKGN